MNSAAEGSIDKELARLVSAVGSGDFDVAISGLKDFLAAHPDHEIGLGLLAASYFQIGSRERARALYERLLAAYPTNALARFQLGLLRLSDAPRESLALWAPLLHGDSEFMAHFHSALAHLQLNEPDAARPLLEHAAQYMPDGHPLREQLNRLLNMLRADRSGVTGYSQ